MTVAISTKIRVTGALIAVATCFSSTAASATTAPVSINPFVALSAYGTLQSRSAVCGAAVGTVAAPAAGQTPVQGCVLPVVDPVPVAATEPAPPLASAPPVVLAPAGAGFGIGALLAGLVLVAGLAAALLSSTGDSDGRLPISPD